MKRAALFVFFTLLGVGVVFGGDKGKDNPLKGKYNDIKVVQFTIEPGVGFPEAYMSKMQADLINEIVAKKAFHQVFAAENKPEKIDHKVVRLEGNIIEFKPGNQAERYLVGFGAGQTKIVANVKFIDDETSEVLYQDKVDGKVVMGLLGGSSPGATRGLAKEVAKKAVAKFQ